MSSDKNTVTFKRRYPKLGKCVFCCCCTPKSSVMACTILLLIFEVYGILSYFLNNVNIDVRTFGTIYEITFYTTKVLSVAAIISYILLLFGVAKVKFAFLNQFKIFYVFYLIYGIYSIVIAFFLYSNDAYINKTVEVTKQQYTKLLTPYRNGLVDLPSDEELRSTVKSMGMRTMSLTSIVFLLYVYYYLTTCSYIEDLEEEDAKTNEVRNLEDNNY